MSEISNSKNGSSPLDPLTFEQFQLFNQYKHKATRTTFDAWLVKVYFSKLEVMLYPDSWTPNCVTMIGQMPQVIMLLVVFSLTGMAMTTAEQQPARPLFIMMGIALNIFTHSDVMDGLRARRQKTGTAFGRIFDEALDMVQQTCYSIWIGYLCKFDNYLLEQIFLMTNVVFHSMELKYMMCKGQLQMNVGEIGPLELEFFLSSLLIIIGGFVGSDVMQLSMGDLFGATNETVAAIQLKHITGCIFLPLLFTFLYEHLGDCIKVSAKTTFYYMISPMIIIFEGFLLSYTVAYQYERAIFYVFLNMCNANCTFQLMITNMSGKPYNILQHAYLYPLIPFFLSFVPGSEAYICPLTRFLALFAFLNFVFDVWRLARQFLRITGRTFWIRPQATLSSSIVL